MMLTNGLPASACAYERYDPVTLKPINTETEVRLAELEWTEAEFKGKTVLDIGCNTGILSIWAHKLGAQSITGIEIQPPLVEFLKSVVQHHKLPISVITGDYRKLDPAKNRHDVVLFMEVLHWAVSQGTPLRTVIQKLAALTGETLFIEFPWSVDEPSIKAQTKMTALDYSADTALEELGRFFEYVEVVRFMRYFGFASKSRRILIKATGRRPEADLLLALDGFQPLMGNTRKHGLNPNFVLYRQQGLYFAKRLSPGSRLILLTDAEINELMADLARNTASSLIVPIRINDRYLHRAGNSAYMLFDYLGSMFSNLSTRGSIETTETLIAALLDLRCTFQQVPDKFIGIFHQACKRPESDSLGKARDSAVAFLDAGQIAIFDELVLNSSAQLRGSARDAICHNDLQTGNFLMHEGRLRIADLDNFGLGSAYSDMMTALVWRGCAANEIVGAIRQQAMKETRPPGPSDVAVALDICFAWFNAFQSLGGNLESKQAGLFKAGVANLITVCHILQPA